jgi:hypothetical protein
MRPGCAFWDCAAKDREQVRTEPVQLLDRPDIEAGTVDHFTKADLVERIHAFRTACTTRRTLAKPFARMRRFTMARMRSNGLIEGGCRVSERPAAGEKQMEGMPRHLRLNALTVS